MAILGSAWSMRSRYRARLSVAIHVVLPSTHAHLRLFGWAARRRLRRWSTTWPAPRRASPPASATTSPADGPATETIHPVARLAGRPPRDDDGRAVLRPHSGCIGVGLVETGRSEKYGTNVSF